jgi:Tfp pilus assembly ATPase PilU
MQLLDEHLWQLYDNGKIALDEMLDKARQPGPLQDKAMTKLRRVHGAKYQKETEDIGPILRT